VNRRHVIIGVATAAVVGAVVPTFAATSSTSPVTVHVSTTNGVSVGVGVLGQPGAGASVGDGGTVCAGIGEQVPVCTPSVSARQTRQSLPSAPIVVRRDDNGTLVAVGEVGVSISSSGEVCPEVSTQDWVCVHLG
jgi:hypothetical protein